MPIRICILCTSCIHPGWWRSEVLITVALASFDFKVTMQCIEGKSTDESYVKNVSHTSFTMDKASWFALVKLLVYACKCLWIAVSSIVIIVMNLLTCHGFNMFQADSMYGCFLAYVFLLISSYVFRYNTAKAYKKMLQFLGMHCV